MIKRTDIFFAFLKTDFFELLITSTHKGVSGIYFMKDKEGYLNSDEVKRGLQTGALIHSQKFLERPIRELDAYFSGLLKKFTIEVDAPGTVFQQNVWDALKKIPYGTTVSYSEIALRINSPRAMRAVGNANNKNPVPIIVPCHRVIGKNGNISGYAPGEKYKQILLNLEQKNNLTFKHNQEELHTKDAGHNFHLGRFNGRK